MKYLKIKINRHVLSSVKLLKGENYGSKYKNRIYKEHIK